MSFDALAGPIDGLFRRRADSTPLRNVTDVIRRMSMTMPHWTTEAEPTEPTEPTEPGTDIEMSVSINGSFSPQSDVAAMKHGKAMDKSTKELNRDKTSLVILFSIPIVCLGHSVSLLSIQLHTHT